MQFQSLILGAVKQLGYSGDGIGGTAFIAGTEHPDQCVAVRIQASDPLTELRWLPAQAITERGQKQSRSARHSHGGSRGHHDGSVPSHTPE